MCHLVNELKKYTAETNKQTNENLKRRKKKTKSKSKKQTQGLLAADLRTDQEDLRI